MKKETFLIICLAAVILSAGCTNPPVEEIDEEQVSGGDQTVEVEQTGANEETVPTDPLEEIKGLFESHPQEYMVEYTTTMTVKGREESPTRMLLFYKGTDRLRTDVVQEGTESRSYLNGNGLVMCNKEGAEWICYNVSSEYDTGEEVNQNMAEIRNYMDTNPVTSLPDRVIAGVNCKCFMITITPDTQEGDQGTFDGKQSYCVSPEGILLYTQTDTQDISMIMEAVRYSTNVSDDEFIPPAETVDLEEFVMDKMSNPFSEAGGDGVEMPVGGMDGGETPEDLMEMQCEMCAKMPDEDSSQECRKLYECDTV